MTDTQGDPPTHIKDAAQALLAGFPDQLRKIRKDRGISCRDPAQRLIDGRCHDDTTGGRPYGHP